MAKVTVGIPTAVTKFYTCNLTNNQQLTIGESITITLEALEYYGTPTPPYIRWMTYGSEYGDRLIFTQVDAKHWILTTSFNEYGTEANRTVQIQAPETVKMFFSLDAGSLVQCSCSLSSGEYDPSLVDGFLVTCETGYEFPEPPRMTYKIGTKDYTEQLVPIDSNTYSLTGFTFSPGITYTLAGEAIHKTIIFDKYGLITAYRLSKAELVQVASNRFIKRSWDPKTWDGATVYFVANEEYIDTAKYVVSLFKIFINLTTSQRERLYFGPYYMDMECEVLDTDIITLDFGSVSIEGKYHNSIDYENTTLEAYLPFVGMVTLNTYDYMDSTVSLAYQINIVNGDALAILSVDDNVMNTFKCSVCFNIPYELSASEVVETNLNPATSDYVVGEAPFIYVKESIAMTPNEHLPYKDTRYYARFGDLTGYTEASEIDFEVLSDHITKTEIDEIKSLLANGVFL